MIRSHSNTRSTAGRRTLQHSTGTATFTRFEPHKKQRAPANWSTRHIRRTPVAHPSSSPPVRHRARHTSLHPHQSRQRSTPQHNTLTVHSTEGNGLELGEPSCSLRTRGGDWHVPRPTQQESQKPLNVSDVTAMCVSGCGSVRRRGVECVYHNRESMGLVMHGAGVIWLACPESVPSLL